MKKVFSIFLLLSSFGNAKQFNKKSFEESLSEIKRQSYYSLSDDEIYKAALKGVLHQLELKNKDKNFFKKKNESANTLLPPRNLNEMKREMKGEISGIGVSIKFDREKGQKYPEIIDVIAGGGAEEAGLKVGDQLLKVSDRSVTEFRGFMDLIYEIRGKSGTRVKISLLRNGELLSKKVKRKLIEWDAVKLVESSENLSVIQLRFFNEKTSEKLKGILSKLKRENKKNVVLDLRENMGGLFEEGVKSIKLFSKKGQKLLSVKYSQEEKVFKADKTGIGHGMKIYILVDENTKSMGEAFSSVLRINSGAKIIGEKTFGKGTMEKVLTLKNKYSLKVTVGQLFNGNGETWDKVGIIPDIVFPSQKPGEEYQLELVKSLINEN